MLGERLHMRRQMLGLSQQDLADRVGVSKMSISKYERDKMMPSSTVLIALAQALDVSVDYLTRRTTVSLGRASYRCSVEMSASQERQVLATVQEWLERYLEIEEIHRPRAAFRCPDILREVHKLEEVEAVAEALRDAWDVGNDPIDSVTELLEQHGIKVGTVNVSDGFDALLVWSEDHTVPVIVIQKGLPGDRQRFNLAHELGHLVLQPKAALDEEKLAHRFAGAFLVPREAVFRELGQRRDALDVGELYLLKQRYGLSMQAWIHRAYDLGVISKGLYHRTFELLEENGWRQREPGDPYPSETSTRMKRLVLGALAEGVISQSHAAQLLAVPLSSLHNLEAIVA